MKLRTTLIIHFVVAIVNSTAVMFVPVQYLQLFDLDLATPAAVFTARLLGAGLFTYAAITFFGVQSGPSQARRAIAIGIALSAGAGSAVCLVGIFTGVVGPLFWLAAAMYVGVGALYVVSIATGDGLAVG